MLLIFSGDVASLLSMLLDLSTKPIDPKDGVDKLEPMNVSIGVSMMAFMASSNSLSSPVESGISTWDFVAGAEGRSFPGGLEAIFGQSRFKWVVEPHLWHVNLFPLLSKGFWRPPFPPPLAANAGEDRRTFLPRPLAPRPKPRVGFRDWPNLLRGYRPRMLRQFLRALLYLK